MYEYELIQPAVDPEEAAGENEVEYERECHAHHPGGVAAGSPHQLAVTALAVAVATSHLYDLREIFQQSVSLIWIPRNFSAEICFIPTYL
jgi:hypothetical protein